MARRSFIGVLALLGVVGLVGSHQLFADKPQKNSRANAQARPTSIKPLTLPDQFPLNVSIDPRSPAPLKEKYQALVDIIEWFAGLEAVEETPEGLMVKLKVYAKRKNVIDGLFYYEYYLISDRGAQLIQWEHEPAQTRDVMGF